MAKKLNSGGDFELAADTLSGDVRDALLMQIRDLKRPWSALSEAEQREKVNLMEAAAKDLVRSCLRLVNDYPHPHAVVRLGEVKICGGDKGIESKISAQNVESHRDVLGEHVGSLCMLLMVDSETFFGERDAPDIDPDQRDLGVDV